MDTLYMEHWDTLYLEQCDTFTWAENFRMVDIGINA